MSTQFIVQKHFYFKLFKQLYVTIQLKVNTVLMSKTVLFQIIQLSKTFLFQAIQFIQRIQFSISMLLVLFNP